ncbi:hypothetical protein HMPREF9460_02379 [Flavonifractor plautii 1_3_50AFAA]|uniref:Cobalamin biosynthesis protein CobD n=3 Tax=Flavonifractor TaxID=946234 RepID=A0A096CJI3_FLAPL|nr:hypothetical protein HMPREF9460_02379 [Flavonifractor plautii 1_3_50AFAA]
MELILMRHGTTQGNLERRFIGTLDVPLLPQGEELARRVGATLPAVEHIYRSPLQRCRRTAELLWPGVEMTVVDELRESDFGPFEGKNHEELKDDPLYQAWLGMGDRPNFAAMPVGESAQQVTDRVSIGLEKTAADAARRGFGRVGVVSHGGALMALLAKYGRPERDYYGWMCPNCGGFRAELNPDTLELTILEEYRGGEGAMSWGVSHLLALLTGFCLDLLLGDPHWAPHPVRAVGVLIAALEKLLRRLFPKSPGGELAGGAALVALTIAIPTGLTALLLWGCGLLSPWLAFAAEALLCYQLLAAKSLRDESDKVYEALKAGDLPGARHAVSMIVGRDTERLDEAGVAKAAVETVAENASDGVIAPLIFLALGGAPLGMLYKAVNTMDSMVGYKNDRYLYFGRAAARLDDALNFLPARIAGVLMCLGGAAAGYDGKNAWRIFRRDRKRHKSPNSAHTEAACAGALQLQLAGPNYYFGQLVDKPTIGDDQRPVEALDILRAGRILYATAFFALLLFCGVPLLILLFP